MNASQQRSSLWPLREEADLRAGPGAQGRPQRQHPESGLPLLLSRNRNTRRILSPGLLLEGSASVGWEGMGVGAQPCLQQPTLPTWCLPLR